MAARALSDRAALALLVGVLAAYNVVRSAWLPAGVHLLANVAMAGVVVAIARAAGVGRIELRLARHHVPAGVRLGMLALAAIAVIVTLAALVAEPVDLAGSMIDLSMAEMWWRVLVAIPLGTVLLEELAFRGVLAALLVRLLGARQALWCGAGVFGLWHIAPALSDDRGSGWTAVVATVIGTAAAGAAFEWLARRSRSLLAPTIAHWATNGLSLLIVWTVAQR
jgi:membrane protease YdiL (CAAX protease family)